MFLQLLRPVLASSLSCKSNFVNLTFCKLPNFILEQNFVPMLMLKVETASHEQRRSVEIRKHYTGKDTDNDFRIPSRSNGKFTCAIGS